MRRAVTLASFVFVPGLASPQQVVLDGVRAPAFAADGRLAISAAGDLWVLEPDGTGGFTAARQLTADGAWDRDPAWTRDGRALVFASDRDGTFDLWRIEVAAGDAPPQRLTESDDHDVEPNVGPDGTIVFARGRGGDSDLWTR